MNIRDGAKRLALISALCGLSHGAIGAKELITRGDFSSPSYWDIQGNVDFSDITSEHCDDKGCFDYSGHLACLNNTGSQLSHSWMTEVGSSFTGLSPDTRYVLTVRGFRDIAGNDSPGGETPRLKVRVSALHSNDTYVYDELQLNNVRLPEQTVVSRADLSRALSQPHKITFTTPVADDDSSGNYKARIDLTAGSGASDIPLCLTEVSLRQLNEPTTERPRIAINQEGYGIGQPKVATFAVSGEFSENHDLAWFLRRNGNMVTTDGSTNVAKAIGGDIPETQAQADNLPENEQYSTPLTLDPDSGDKTANIDFSKVRDWNSQFDNSEVPAGRYTIMVYDKNMMALIASSREIELTERDIYADLAWDSLRSFYHQHSDKAIDPPFMADSMVQGKEFAREAGHPSDSGKCFSGVDQHGNDWSATWDLRGTTVEDAGCVIDYETYGGSVKKDYRASGEGGWYDAADHGKYVVNGAASLWRLQNVIERMQKTGDDHGPYYENLLDEARYEMEFLLEMQIPNSAPIIRALVPLGYQDENPAPTSGISNRDDFSESDRGVYQVDKTGDYLGGPDATGAIPFNGGQVPKLHMKLDLQKANVEGMVFHAIHDEEWTGIPLAPENDNKDRVVMYPTSAATLNLAAVGAQCYRIWRHERYELAEHCLAAANVAWKKATELHDQGNSIFRYDYSNNPMADSDSSGNNLSLLQYGFAVSPMFSGGGAYGDSKLSDEIYWAGMEMYLAARQEESGSASYNARHYHYDRGNYQGGLDLWTPADYLDYATTEGFVASGADKYGVHSQCKVDGASVDYPAHCYDWLDVFNWQNTHSMGTISLTSALDDATLETEFPEAKSNIIDYAEKLWDYTVDQGYLFPRRPYDPSNRDTHYGWGSNGNVLNRAIMLGIASELTDNADQASRFRDAVKFAMDYLMGRNSLQQSYISGYGETGALNPHHRFFAKHADMDFPAIPDGFVMGGPNSGDIGALRANASRNGNGDIAEGSSAEFYDSVVAPECSGLVGEEQEALNTLPATYDPQRCYKDHYKSFAGNEVAINWQASLVWVSHFLSTDLTLPDGKGANWIAGDNESHRIVSATDPDKCLVAHGYWEAHLGWCSSPYGGWEYNSSDQTLRLDDHDHVCLTASSGPLVEGNEIRTRGCDWLGHSDRAQWFSDDEGRIHLKAAPELCIHTQNSSGEQGTKLHLWTCEYDWDNPNEKWSRR